MKATIERATLLKSLSHVQSVVERRNTIPILSNVLIEASADGAIKLMATDLDLQVVESISAQVEQPGATTISAHTLFDIARKLPEGSQVSLQAADGKMLIQAGRARFNLSTLPRDDFPVIAEGDLPTQFELPAETLKQIIDKTRFAISTEETRYYLNGIYFHVSDEGQPVLKAAATDGHRLATCVTEVSGLAETRQIILPRKGVLEMAKLLTDPEASVSLSLSANHLRAQTEEFTFTSKLVDGKFPDYSRVIPKGGNNVVLADRTDLRQVFNRTAILSNEKYRGVRLVLGTDTLQVFANNPEQEEAEETTAVEYQGDALEIGFNVSYLQDVLGVISTEQVKFTLSDANSSALIEEPDSSDAMYVVMPMRL